MLRLGLVDILVTHANMKGFGLTPLFGDRRGYMPPQLKTKHSIWYNCATYLLVGVAAHGDVTRTRLGVR